MRVRPVQIIGEFVTFVFSLSVCGWNYWKLLTMDVPVCTESELQVNQDGRYPLQLSPVSNLCSDCDAHTHTLTCVTKRL